MSIDHVTAKFIAVILNQSISYRRKIAGNLLIQFVESEIDSVVSQPVLRKIISANSLTAIT